MHLFEGCFEFEMVINSFSSSTQGLPGMYERDWAISFVMSSTMTLCYESIMPASCFFPELTQLPHFLEF